MARKNHSDIIDIRGLLNSYISKWYLFVFAILGCLLIAFLYLRISQTQYGVRANILIQQEDSNPMSMAMGGLGDLFGSSGYVDDEIFVISSHSLYRDVVRDLGLNKIHYVKQGFLKKSLTYPDFPIDVYPAAGIADTLRYSINFRVEVNEDGLADVKIKDHTGTIEKVSEITLPHTFKTPYGEFTVDTTQYFPKGEDVTSTIIFTGYHAAAEDLALDISSEIANKKTNVIEIAYNTPNSTMGEIILRDIIEKYNERGIREKNLQSQKTAEFISQRLALLGSDLSSAELDIQNYKESQGIVDVAAEALYQNQKRGEVEAELITAETQMEIIRLTRDFVSNSENNYELIPVTVELEGLQTAISDYNISLIERAEMLQVVNPDNAAVVKLTARCDAMRANIISSVNQLYDQTSVKVRDLRSQLNTTGSRLGNIPRQERAEIDLLRQREVKQELYLFLLQRQEENAMLMANTTPKGIIVDEPYTLKEPLSMESYMVLFIALMFGLFIPPVYLYILKLVRNKVETKDEIESRTSAPILGEMCIVNTNNPLVVSPTDTTSATELFRLMRSNMLFIFNDTNDKVAMLTSSTSGEGKTFISINLAASLALLNKKVLLIGMDIRMPRIASYLNLNNPMGLTQYLSSSSIELDKIIVKNAVENIPSLDVIVAGPVPPNPSELLASSKVDELFAELRTRYDYIIVDSAPIGLVSDSFSLNRISDATIYVSRLNVTTANNIDYIEEIYQEKRLKKLSIVVNGVKSKKTYGYGNKNKSTY